VIPGHPLAERAARAPRRRSGARAPSLAAEPERWGWPEVEAHARRGALDPECGRVAEALLHRLAAGERSVQLAGEVLCLPFFTGGSKP
jgi:hypothetical protein